MQTSFRMVSGFSLLVVGALLVLSSSAYADAIGVSFYDSSSASADNTLLSTDSVGIVPHTSWNNVDAHDNGGSLNVTIATSTGGDSATLDIQSSGTAQNGRTRYFGGNANWNASDDLDPTQALYNGNIQTSNNVGFTLEIQLTDIPFEKYDVYAYYIAGRGDQRGSIQAFPGGVGGDIFYFGRTQDWYPGSNLPSSGDLVQATATTLGDAAAGTNYVRFTGLTESTVYLDFNAENGPSIQQFEIGGLQIVEVPVPEPGSLALLGLGGFAMLARRRKA